MSSRLKQALIVLGVVSLAAAGETQGAAAIAAPPELEKTMIVERLRGSVRVKPKGATGFRNVAKRRVVPLESILDTTDGRAAVTTALAGTQTQTFEFELGQVLIEQFADVTSARLVGGNGSECESLLPGAEASRRRRGRYPRIRTRSRGRHGPFRVRGRYSATIAHGTDLTVADSCEGTLTEVLEGNAAVNQKLTQPSRPSGRHVMRQAPASSNVATELMKGGQSLQINCVERDYPFAGRTCMRAFVEPPFFALSISSEVYLGNYDLCLLEPDGKERCHSYDFGPLGVFPIVILGRQRPVSLARRLRASTVGCVTTAAGTYRARWTVGGVPVDLPFLFTVGAGTDPTEPERGTCSAETTLVAGTDDFGPAVATTPPFVYGEVATPSAVFRDRWSAESFGL